MAKEAIDQKFFSILSKMIDLAVATTGQCTQEVLKVSESYLEEKAHKTLEDFYNLYFAAELQEDKASVNHEVDDIFNQAMAQKDSSEEIKIEVAETAETKRLGLSTVQKQLEGVISLNQGMKQELTPVLSSMQFEDATRQRLEHIEAGWKQIIAVNCCEDKVDFEAIKTSLSSVEETAIFYKIVLKEEPPAEPEKAESVLFF